MYVKENDKWEKEGPGNEKLKHVVQKVEHKNIRLLVDYCKEHPDCIDPDSPENDDYLRMSSIATSGTDEHLDKIITKIAKEVLIDKWKCGMGGSGVGPLKKNAFLDLILKKSILDIYFCPNIKKKKRVAAKSFQKVTCDHNALISVFGPKKSWR